MLFENSGFTIGQCRRFFTTGRNSWSGWAITKLWDIRTNSKVIDQEINIPEEYLSDNCSLNLS
jgi:hypothetical protein